MNESVKQSIEEDRPWNEEAILYLLFRYPSLDVEMVSLEWFSMEYYRTIYKAIIGWRIDGKVSDITAFCQGELSDFFTIYVKCERFVVTPTFFDSYCQQLKEEYLELSIWQLIEEVKAAGSEEESVEKVCS